MQVGPPVFIFGDAIARIRSPLYAGRTSVVSYVPRKPWLGSKLFVWRSLVLMNSGLGPFLFQKVVLLTSRMPYLKPAQRQLIWAVFKF